MSLMEFNDFGELYRAAFAEKDERKKSSLLQDVQRVIDRCQHEPQQAEFEAQAA